MLSLGLCLFSLEDIGDGFVDFEDHVGREVLFLTLLFVEGPIRRVVVFVVVVVVVVVGL